MTVTKLLVANRGEIAIRILRAARDLDIATVAVASADDIASLHTRLADELVVLDARGAGAYLDVDAIVGAAISAGCDSLHPGYGFLAENPELALACERVGLTFVGPSAAQLRLFGDKVAARELAERLGVPLAPGTRGPTTLAEAEQFLATHGAMMIKAIAGGGGRGMRPVRAGDDVGAAYERSRSEAQAAFGNPEVYVERLIDRARHIEVQIVGDGKSVVHLGERECTLQRQRQKLVEIAPSPTLAPETRQRLTAAAIAMAAEVQYQSLGTWEFLVDADDPSIVAFMEVNARVQVEHTVTEEVTGIDLVQTQLRLASGAGLAEAGIDQESDPSIPRGFAVQARVNTETMQVDGTGQPSGGTFRAFEAPSGPGVRTDTYGYVGYTTNPGFDSLIAKVIGWAPRYEEALARTRRALGEFRLDGVSTNVGFLQALLSRPEVRANTITTAFVEVHAPDLLAESETFDQRYFAAPGTGLPATSGAGPSAGTADGSAGLAGARVDATDPLAVLKHGDVEAVSPDSVDQDRGPAGLAGSGPVSSAPTSGPPPIPVVNVAGAAESATANKGIAAVTTGMAAVSAPLQGTVVSVAVGVGDAVAEGSTVLVMEAMKMEHEITAPVTGVIDQVAVAAGDVIFAGHVMMVVQPADVEVERGAEAAEIDPDYIRPDLAEMYERRAYGLDENRPDAVAKRHGRGNRTARENVEQLVDEGTFFEYGRLMLAAQRRRRDVQDLRENTSGDGMVAGVGGVNGDLFGPDRSQAVIMSYDYMVLAGTQGGQNHRKKDRLFEIAEHQQLPVVLYAEGGGGRPGDTDGIGGSGLDTMAFALFAGLSGLVPLVGITNGRCFAGNAVLLGCCDVIIATEGSNIGVGGPAMVEGGGLGVFKPEEIGPVEVQAPNGVIDVLVRDEEEATEVAKKYLSYFQGSIDDWEAPDQRALRHLVPENRKRVYDMRQIIENLCDVGSVLELREHWGPGLITVLARIEGRPVGIAANNPHHLAGAIDADAGDKGARFIQLCDAHDIPLLFLADTPGIMVGPEAEHEATVRRAARMFVNAAGATVPMMTVIIRKGYGLGVQAMAGGSFKATTFTVSWPTGEFGGMGLEGFVKLGYRKELEAIEDPTERMAAYQQRVDRLYDMGKAVNTASYFELDDVIDPAETRQWIMMALRSSPPPNRTGKKRPNIDTW